MVTKVLLWAAHLRAVLLSFVASVVADARHFYDRLKADTPKYWRVVQIRAGVVAGALETLIQSGHCPAHLLEWAQRAACALAALVFMAQATKCDAPAAPASPPASQDSENVTT